MVEAQRKTVSFDEFIAWYPENSQHRYELHQGVIIEMPKPRGKHSGNSLNELLDFPKA
ncbi:MAG: hypothetical protein BRC33_13840 [Cyanobacteria bacterium SW_9_44_58]|nr:MAG: hypothetical protein BRC33_13840 [Cyanobacteria bacterium SW_9_44_58]